MILAFTGAGISQPSGIPTFAEQEGIRDSLERSFAATHPQGYQRIIDKMQRRCETAQPNDAHLVLKEYGIAVITMNIDGLHQRAGSEHVLPIHGTLPDIVLYGDHAPLYADAISWVRRLRPGDHFLIVGTSFYTAISCNLYALALSMGTSIYQITSDSQHEVRRFLERTVITSETFESFMAREQNG